MTNAKNMSPEDGRHRLRWPRTAQKNETRQNLCQAVFLSNFREWKAAFFLPGANGLPGKAKIFTLVLRRNHLNVNKSEFHKIQI